MCGIAGFLSSRPLEDPLPLLRKMTDAIRHRGPDDCGFYTDTFAALGHRRLSIIDVAGGHQPMTNEDGTLQIVFNGEIFNHSALRPGLEAKGHRYRTHCDTEAILHSYEEDAERCLQQLHGMFAFAIWDSRRKTLFCARDRMGKKPFYYYCDGRTFAFASEIKSLLELPFLTAALDADCLPEYLSLGFTSGDRTLFRRVRRLLPGHWLKLDLSAGQAEPTVQSYWDVPAARPEGGRPLSEWTQETRRRVEAAVESRLMSDVPLGSFLSGGVDSSAITAMAGRISGTRMKTFSVGYREQPYSELGYAAAVSKALGTEHHEARVSETEFFNALPSLIWHEDEPITWPSSVPLYFVSQLASQHVKVVLTGEGSDELFGGYERYRWTQLNRRGASVFQVVPGALRSGIRRFVATSHLLRADLRRKLAHTFLGRDSSIEGLLLDNFYAAFPREELSRVLPGAKPGDAYAAYMAAFDRKEQTVLARMLYADQKTYLAQLLMKQDRMSMAASIESRVPLLDDRLVEFAATIPDHYKIHRGEQKYIFKRAVEDLLPREIVYRKKMGFPTPLRMWMRNEQARPLLNEMTRPDGFLASVADCKVIGQLLERHQSGYADHTDALWRLLNLQLWGEIFVTGKRAPGPASEIPASSPRA